MFAANPLDFPVNHSSLGRLFCQALVCSPNPPHNSIYENIDRFPISLVSPSRVRSVGLGVAVRSTQEALLEISNAD